MSAGTPGQAAPPELFARWFRVVSRNAGDEDVARCWRDAISADREFWTELQAAIAARPRDTTADGFRSELEATVRIWREESEPYDGESPEEIARRGGFAYCADELAQVLARHPEEPQTAPATADGQAAAELAIRLLREELDGARDRLALLREAITVLAEDITASAGATRPSRKTQLEDEFAIMLRKLLEQP